MAIVIGFVSRANTSATSRSFQTQRNWKIASEAIAGSPRGRISRTKMRNSEAPSIRADQDVLRDPDEEISQQEDRERQPEGSMEEDEAPDRVVEVEVVVDAVHRDQRHLQRYDQEGNHQQEKPIPAGKSSQAKA